MVTKAELFVHELLGHIFLIGFQSKGLLLIMIFVDILSLLLECKSEFY